jgi:hypothetical protein
VGVCVVGGKYELNSGTPKSIGHPLEMRVLFANFSGSERPWADCEFRAAADECSGN